uniref:Uncharacterized protein n=1 Tax=Anguilla anguilla TaxID=7936 RepID=A0A0E9RDV0_ANGAN
MVLTHWSIFICSSTETESVISYYNNVYMFICSHYNIMDGIFTYV